MCHQKTEAYELSVVSEYQQMRERKRQQKLAATASAAASESLKAGSKANASPTKTPVHSEQPQPFCMHSLMKGNKSFVFCLFVCGVRLLACVCVGACL